MSIPLEEHPMHCSIEISLSAVALIKMFLFDWKKLIIAGLPPTRQRKPLIGPKDGTLSVSFMI